MSATADRITELLARMTPEEVSKTIGTSMAISSHLFDDPRVSESVTENVAGLILAQRNKPEDKQDNPKL